MISKWFVIFSLIVVVAAFVFSIMAVLSVNQSGQALVDEIYLTQEACEQAYGRACDVVTCDYIPESKTFAEVCGKDFQNHWIPVNGQYEVGGSMASSQCSPAIIIETLRASPEEAMRISNLYKECSAQTTQESCLRVDRFYSDEGKWLSDGEPDCSWQDN